MKFQDFQRQQKKLLTERNNFHQTFPSAKKIHFKITLHNIPYLSKKKMKRPFLRSLQFLILFCII